MLARYPDLDDATLDPLVLDVALVEGGLFGQFLAERGPLLPEDERLLAEAWMLVERTVYEVMAVDAAYGVSVRDLRTGDRLDVSDRVLSGRTSVGHRLCARAVPDGIGHRFVGALLAVEPGAERHVIELLDEGDGIGLLEWVADREAGPQIVSVEGDELMLCTAVLAVPDGAAAVLDKAFSRADDGWIWSVDAGGDATRILASMALAEDRLIATAVTERRMDDLLVRLAEFLPGSAVVSETREPPDFDAVPPSAPAPVDPDVVAEVQDQMERRWCEEPVPALDGLRPRDAVEDPTRRADVTRLIASFPEIDPASGASACARTGCWSSSACADSGAAEAPEGRVHLGPVVRRPERRQRCSQEAAVAGGRQAWVEDRDDAAVVHPAQQPARPLRQ